jgi:restriction system protein
MSLLPTRTLMWSMLAEAKPAKPNLIGPAAHGLEHDLIAFWPLWLFLLLVALGKLAWRVYQLRRLSKSGIAEIDQMDGHTFEEYLRTLFRRLGYHVELTRRRGDYGADLVVTKGKKRIAVQAKRWSKSVGVKAVQEAVASKAMYSCDGALVVANRQFTKPAQKLAGANKVELWGRDVLVQKLLSVRGRAAAPERVVLEPVPVSGDVAAGAASHAPTATATPHATESASAAPPSKAACSGGAAATDKAASAPMTPAAGATCVTCGVTVSERVRDYCLQHSARFGGRIYCFRHQRGIRAMPASGD